MDRRDLIRLLALVSVGASMPGALAACSDGGSGDGGPGGGSGGPGGDSDLKLVASELERGAGRPEAIPDVVSGLHRLGGRLYGELLGDEPNLALSPYSIAVALAMTANGARGETAAQMQEVLGAPDLGDYNSGLNALTQALESLAGPTKRADGSDAEIALDAANQLFGQHDTPWTGAFLDVLAREYGAGMRTVDFETATEAARTLINEWTAEQTHDRIPEIIPAGVLEVMTRLVLVNAIYLKAPWEVPFEPSLTGKQPFHAPDGTVEVDTMAGQPAAHVSAGEGWQAARLDYAGGRLAMTLVLPDDGRLAEVEAAVVDGGFGAVLAGSRPAMLDLTLPRWTFRSDLRLNDALVALGMPLAFDAGRADFLGMTDNDLQLVISAVLHQAFIAVDEEGTEAAAATAVVMNETSAPRLEPFHVDRPFLFVIHDVEHGTPLFLGRVADPR